MNNQELNRLETGILLEIRDTCFTSMGHAMHYLPKYLTFFCVDSNECSFGKAQSKYPRTVLHGLEGTSGGTKLLIRPPK